MMVQRIGQDIQVGDVIIFQGKGRAHEPINF